MVTKNCNAAAANPANLYCSPTGPMQRDLPMQ